MVKRTPSPTGRKSATRKAGKAATDKAAWPDTYTVFISHSSKESWIAGQIGKEIERVGAQTWLDKKDLRGGDEIRRTVKRGIRTCQEVVVLLSAHSVGSPWVSFEVGAAYMLNNTDPDSLPPMQGVKAIDLNAFDDFLLELTERLTPKR